MCECGGSEASVEGAKRQTEPLAARLERLRASVEGAAASIIEGAKRASVEGAACGEA